MQNENTDQAATEWWTSFLKEKEQAASKRKDDRRELLPKLKESGITQVHWTYEGSGDSGCFAQTSCTLNAVAESPIPEVFKEVLDNIGYGTLEDYHGGWEINEGSFGDMKWDVAADRIKIEHNQRVEDTVYDEKEV